jgi:hypothetical protein
MNIPAPCLDKIRSVFPTLSFDTLEFNQDGMANEVVIVNGELVCRFAKGEWAKKVLQPEARVLELVQKPVDSPVPMVEHLEEGFVCYRLLRGQPLTREILLRLPRADRLRVHTPLVVSDVLMTGQTTEKVVVLAKALKGSLGGNLDAEDFSLEFSLVDKGSSTELTIRPRSASNETARQVVTDYVAALDKNWERSE